MTKKFTTASRIFFLFAFILSFISTAPVSARPISAPAVAGDELWGSYLTGTNAIVFAVLASGSDVYVGGDFTSAGGLPVNHVARWSSATHRWYALGTGVNNRVTALALYGTHLYVGGSFNSAGGQAIQDLAMWDTLNQIWSPVGSGVITMTSISPSVNALAIYGSGNLIVGGQFESIGGVTARNIAFWNGASWLALGSGLGDGTISEEVNSLAVDGTELYAGGDFATYHCVAHWNGFNWQGLGSGTTDSSNAKVDAIAISGTNVYIAGWFDRVADSGGAHTVNSIAYWGADNLWHNLGTGLNAGAYTLAVSAGGNVYVGGQFSTAGGVTTSHLAVWNGSNWLPVNGAFLTQGTDANVNALFMNGTALYVGGSFVTAADADIRGIGRYDTTSGAWSGLGSSVDGSVTALAVSGTDVYLGGTFRTANGINTPGIAHLQTADGTWSMLGSGGLAGCSGLLFCTPVVKAILVTPTDVFITGNFGSVGGVTANGIARWNKSDQAWHPLGAPADPGLGCSSFGCSYSGAALAYNPTSGMLYVGGSFESAGGLASPNLADWNLYIGWNKVYSPTAINPNGAVDALAWSGTHLYVGGAFTSPTAKLFALNYASVTAVGSEFPNSTVYALAADSSYVYAGGSFTNLSSSGHVARIANTNTPASAAWQSVGSGLDGTVRSLAVSGGRLAAGGDFLNAGATGVNRVALWNGAAWSNLGSGVNNTVQAVAVDNQFVYAGGWFTTVGAAKPSSLFNTWGAWHNYLPITVRQ
jgi:hypothetical protein